MLAAFGTLSALVEAASLSFLFTFAVVCGLAFRLGVGFRLITGFGALAASAATAVLVFRLVTVQPLALAVLLLVVLAAFVGRPLLLRHVAVKFRD